jgi:hypothetical protein
MVLLLVLRNAVRDVAIEIQKFSCTIAAEFERCHHTHVNAPLVNASQSRAGPRIQLTRATGTQLDAAKSKCNKKVQQKRRSLKINLIVPLSSGILRSQCLLSNHTGNSKQSKDTRMYRRTLNAGRRNIMRYPSTCDVHDMYFPATPCNETTHR